MNPGNVAVLPIGGSFLVQVKVASMDQFNGWDIQIFYNQAIINATGLTITGNIFDANTTGGTPFEIVHCVNGKGTSCNTSADGPGVVHSAYGNTAFTSGSGLLFSVTFQVLRADPRDTLAVRNDLVSSSSPSGVPHITISGSYGLFGGGGGGRDVEL